MTQSEAASHWQKRARAELRGAHVLFEKGEPDLYGEVIFHCHLALELALKAQYIQEHNKVAPFTHNLGELAQVLHGDWSESDFTDFDQLSDNAMLARYGDGEWHTKYATKEKAKMWLEKVEKFLSRIQL